MDYYSHRSGLPPLHLGFRIQAGLPNSIAIVTFKLSKSKWLSLINCNCEKTHHYMMKYQSFMKLIYLNTQMLITSSPGKERVTLKKFILYNRYNHIEIGRASSSSFFIGKDFSLSVLQQGPLAERLSSNKIRLRDFWALLHMLHAFSRVLLLTIIGDTSFNDWFIQFGDFMVM